MADLQIVNVTVQSGELIQYEMVEGKIYLQNNSGTQLHVYVKVEHNGSKILELDQPVGAVNWDYDFGFQCVLGNNTLVSTLGHYDGANLIIDETRTDTFIGVVAQPFGRISLVVSPSTISQGQSSTVHAHYENTGNTTLMYKVYGNGIPQGGGILLKGQSFDESYVVSPTKGIYTYTAYLMHATLEGSDTIVLKNAALVVTDPIPNNPPVAIISTPQNHSNFYKDEAISFNGSQSYDPDGTIASYLWDFGDGTTSSEISIAKSYSSVGSYIISLTVIDNGGRSSSSSIDLTISEQPPANRPPVSIISTPLDNTNYLIGENISFNGNESYDPDGEITSYIWDFDDGTTSENPSPNKTYSIAGNYAISLTVIDDDGLSASSSINVVISEEPIEPKSYIWIWPVVIGGVAIGIILLVSKDKKDKKKK